MRSETWNAMKIVALVGGVAAAWPCLASEVAAQSTLRACYVPNTGVVYRIGLEDTADECRSPRHVEFSWADGAGADHGELGGLDDDDHPQYVTESEVAPSAWAGVQGILGPIVFADIASGESRYLQTQASCPNGKIPANGGFRIGTEFTHGVRSEIIGNILESHPSILTDGSSGIWDVSAVVTNNEPQTERVSLSAYAMCVNIAPSQSP
jgi:hypothetical protein